KEIIGTVDRASFEITAMKSAPSGRITIAMPPSIGWGPTVPLVDRCRREFPMIALHVVEGFSGHVTEWLSTGRIDIGVVYNAPRLPALLTEPLLERRRGAPGRAPDPEPALEKRRALQGPARDPACVGAATVPVARLADIPLILPARPHGLR